MSWGGKRIGAGRKTDKKNRKNVQCRLDGAIFEVFTFYCRVLGLNRSTTLEHIMETWMRHYQPSVQTKLQQLEGSLADMDPCELAFFAERVTQLHAFWSRLLAEAKSSTAS
jgi:hypothetical protein